MGKDRAIIVGFMWGLLTLGLLMLSARNFKQGEVAEGIWTSVTALVGFSCLLTFIKSQK